MKKLLIMGLSFTGVWAISLGMTKKCEMATLKSTKIHMEYVDGNATLTDSYNAKLVMDKICGPLKTEENNNKQLHNGNIGR